MPGAAAVRSTFSAPVVRFAPPIVIRARPGPARDPRSARRCGPTGRSSAVRRRRPVRVRDVRRPRRRRLAGRRRVARQRRAAPAVRIGLDAAERRPGQTGAVVDVAQRRRAGGRGVVVVVGRDVQAHPRRVDRGRQDRGRDLDLERVAAGRVGVARRRVVGADPRRARVDLDAGGVRGVVDRRRQRPGGEALVVVGVTRPARAVDAVAVGVGRVVREREDPELERVGRVHRVVGGAAARVDQDLDRVRQPVRDALRRA